MENKNKVLLTVIGVATLLVALVGATFAYFSATDTSETVEVTTGAATISLSAANNSVKDIKPLVISSDSLKSSLSANASSGTEFSDTIKNDIVKMTLNVTGSSDVAGSYDIVMSEPTITIGSEANQGSVSDIKYSVYDSTGKEIKTGSFTGVANENGTVIVDNTTFDGTNDINDTYYVYVYVNNTDSEQNNLQNVNFKLTFAANASTAA